jgi:hypothetical protein
MIYPLGFIFERYSIKGKSKIGPSWNPAINSFNEYESSNSIVIQESQRMISGNNLAQAIFTKLYPEYFSEKSSSMLVMAIVDVFSENPNPDNPLFVVIKSAIRKQIINDYYPIPFFWNDFVMQIMSSSEVDIVRFLEKQQVKNNKANRNYDNYFSVQQKVNIPNKEELPVQESPKESKIENELDVSKEFLDLIAEHVKNEIKSGLYKVNQTGALMHKVDDKYYFVYPVAIEKITGFYNRYTGVSKLSVDLLSKKRDWIIIVNYLLSNC